MRRLFGVDPQVLALALARMAESVGNSFLIVVLPLFISSEFVGGSTFGLTEVAITEDSRREPRALAAWRERSSRCRSRDVRLS